MTLLRFIVGRAGSGKSALIYRELRRRMDEGARGQLLIVPDQYSHTAERRLCKTCGAGVSASAETLSFRNLAARVFLRAGGLASKTLDDGGRLLVMRLAVSAVRGQLKVYGGAEDRPELLSELLAAVGELRSYHVAPERLYEASLDGECGGATGAKLSDLAYIASAYDELLTDELGDPGDVTSLALRRAAECEFFAGRDVYIDGFTAFAPDELSMIALMASQGAEVRLALTGDSSFESTELDASDLFYPTAKLFRELRARCAENGSDCAVEYVGGAEECRQTSAGLRELESKLFAHGAERVSDCGGIELYPARTLRGECETAAALLLGWARAGLRWNELAVVTRDLSIYREELRSVFAACGIPCFIDDVSGVAAKPMFAMLLASFELITENYRLDDVERCVKTGLTAVPDVGSAMLCEYAERWRIEGGKWTRPDDWEYPPEGAPGDAERDVKFLSIANRLRRRLTGPVERLRAAVAGERTGAELASAVYAYATDAGLDRRIARRAERVEKSDARLASEYRQLWDIFCDTLDQFVTTCGSEKLTFAQFAPLYKLLLGTKSVAVIPTSVDEVAVGEAGRTRWSEPRRIVVMGMNDGVFPRSEPDDGILTEKERGFLREKRGMELSPPASEKLFGEQLLAYCAIFTARERAAFTWIESRTASPSVYLDRIRALCPSAEPSEPDFAVHPSLLLARGARYYAPALRRDARTRAIIERADESGKSLKGPIPPDTAAALYGVPLRFSPTKVELFHSCKYEFFLKYGLGLRAFRAAEFDSAETGKLAHYVLERLARQVDEAGGWKNVGEEDICEAVKLYSDEYSKTLPQDSRENPLLCDIVERRTDDLVSLAERMREELRASEFRPFAFERKFGGADGEPYMEFSSGGERVLVGGQLDRADEWTDSDGTRRVRVIDYKTGSTSFNPTDLVYGLKMQIQMYSDALTRGGAKVAGMFYWPMRARVVDAPKNTDDAEIEKKLDKTLRPTGFVESDEKTINAMEKFTGEAKYLPLRRNKDGTLAKSCPLLTQSDFEYLRDFVRDKLAAMSREVKAGRVDADPYVKQSRRACDFCDYCDVCRFDPYAPGENESQRYIKNCRLIDLLAIIDKMRLERGEEESDDGKQVD